jgi:hypothetical protein
VLRHRAPRNDTSTVIAAQVHTIRVNAWYIWLADGDFEDGEHVRREAGFQCMRAKSTSNHTKERRQGAKRKEDAIHAYAFRQRWRLIAIPGRAPAGCEPE